MERYDIDDCGMMKGQKSGTADSNLPSRFRMIVMRHLKGSTAGPRATDLILVLHLRTLPKSQTLRTSMYRNPIINDYTLLVTHRQSPSIPFENS